MSKTEEAQAIIFGSFILYMINALLDASEQSKATTIRLKQLLLAKTRKPQNRLYVEMSNTAWQDVIQKYKDKNYRLAIFDAVEYIGFDVNDMMEKMYGKNFLTYVSSFALKQTFDGIDSEVLKESREICDALKKSVQKVVYDNKSKF